MPVPKAIDRLEKVTAVTWLPPLVADWRVRAADLRARGKTERADQLDQRATKRQGRIGELDAAKQKLDAFASAHCKPAAPSTAPSK